MLRRTRASTGAPAHRLAGPAVAVLAGAGSDPQLHAWNHGRRTAPSAGNDRLGPSRWTSRVVLGLAIGSVLFEQSPANEALRTAVGLEVLQRTQSEWPVGAAIFGLTFLIEGVSSLLIIGGLHLPSTLVTRFTGRFGADAREPARPGRSRLVGAVTDASLTLGVGAGIVVMRHHLRSSNRLLRDDLRIACTATTVVAAVSGAIGVLGAGGIRHAGKVGLETPAQWFVDHATDWRFWLVVFALIQVVSLLRRLLDRRRQRHGSGMPAAGSGSVGREA